MKRKLFVVAAFAGCLALHANAQVAEEATDSLTMDMLVQDLPEVMVKGSRPIVKAEQGKESERSRYLQNGVVGETMNSVCGRRGVA